MNELSDRRKFMIFASEIVIILVADPKIFLARR